MSIERRLDNGGNRSDRAFFRVRALLPLRHERADQRDIEVFLAELEGVGKVRPPDREPTLEERIEHLDQKIERILSLLDPSVPRPLDETDQRPLEISGSGVRYPWPDPVEPGVLLRLHFYLPSTPPRTVRCIGRVVSCREPDLPHRSHSVAVAFEHIAEADRDAIVRHTLEVERQAKRSAESDPVEEVDR